MKTLCCAVFLCLSFRALWLQGGDDDLVPAARPCRTTENRSTIIPFDPVEREIEGWTIDVDPQLLEGDYVDLGARALAMLANHLQRIAIVVPDPRLADLRQIGIWIEYEHPSLIPMQYHPSQEWLVERGHDPRLAGKVHVTRAAQLLDRAQMLKHPAVILHELAHGYHDQFLGFDERRILEVYEKAKASGIYEDVLLHNGRRARHYALTNHKEYFAEGTEAFFYRNDFYPFVRAELEQHDPALYHLLLEIWER